MDHKEKIYDITAWDMTKRVELFLNSQGCRGEIPLGTKIGKFKKSHRFPEMRGAVLEFRNKMAHPKNLAPVFSSREEFKKFQRICFCLEDKLKKEYPNENIRIKEVIPTLKYDMGNAGDIIKHGLLCEFVHWWHKGGGVHLRSGARKMHFADPFAGCPWDNMYKHKAEIYDRRVKGLMGTHFGKAQTGRKMSIYYGSTFLVHHAAKNCGKEAHIFLSDNDEDARCNWENCILGYSTMRLMQLPTGKGGKLNNGYAILDNGQNPGKYDLILLDPYAKFLYDEFGKEKPCRFSRIVELTDNNPNLFIAVFALDMHSMCNPDDSTPGVRKVGKNFAAYKNAHLAERAFSMRCPKITRKPPRSVGGESDYDAEILLINKNIGKYSDLYGQLREFARAAANVLPLDGKVIELWGAGETTPDAPERIGGENE